MSMLLRDFVGLMNKDCPQLAATLTVGDFVRFASLAAKVQKTAGVSLALTPTRTSIIPFLSLALQPQCLDESMVHLWTILFYLLPECLIDSAAAIRDFGLTPALTTKIPEFFLRAPLSHCDICKEKSTLHVHSRIDGYLYDIDGPHPIQTVILCCSNSRCGTYYRPSYYTQDGLRIYYSPDMGRNTHFLHIHCHYYMTTRLAFMFRVLQMLAHVSHFNLVNWYNEVFVDGTPIPTFVADQSFTPSMSEEVCRDRLILHSLMTHSDQRGTQLAVSSSGNDTIRFDSAIENHLQLLSVEGTRFRDHYCSLCVRVLSEVDPASGEESCKGLSGLLVPS
ncbi:uncharacterized protein MELLADRAFT_93172 [Melampsora larici-populina 98AG31]|uniref:CxC5 like cysteine cluster associated with KDZ domain-containing protein n=1 Tax=Melampsora larici-populina (strain 98AG31 / pathotype 3-4-7) TaxID=747676 RepID=F4S4C5_MELLP|nr:uncharacterized protein MELLADRAFT_93172 [Melampsora larici-populina 98AG31]EGG00581.1 hypothetical protein MELLADRAFT_93172 [Melampsora larici-populina 98AG31]